MSIVSSVIVEDSPQVDGRRAVRELHTDGAGGEHEVSYLCEPDDEPKEMLTPRAAQIEEQQAVEQVARQQAAALEKAHAVAVLKLADAEIKAVLKIADAKDVAAVKARLVVEAVK